MILLTAALAGPVPELGLFTGLHIAPSQHELYQAADLPHGPLGPSPALGVRTGLTLVGPLFVEGEAVLGATTRTRGGSLYGLRAHGGLRSNGPNAIGWLIGAGYLGVATREIGNDIDSVAHTGPTLDIRLTDNLGVRADVRAILANRRGIDTGATVHGEGWVGLRWRPKGKGKDTDGDGVSDTSDQCPADAEYRNGYQDSDGCPDLLADIQIKAINAEGDLMRRIGVYADGQRIGMTNRDGRLTLRDQMPGTPLQLEARAEGMQSASIELTPTEGPQSAVLELAWPAGSTVVTARSLGGTPIAANVWALGPESRKWELDAEGHWEGSLPPGEWRILVAAPGYDGFSAIADATQPGPRARVEAILKPQRVRLYDDRIVTLDPIRFEKASHVVVPESLGTVDAVAATMMDNRRIARLEVAGHASSDGTKARNDQLSRQRVAEVVRLLVERGVDQNRLVERSYGEERPAVDEDSEEGRAENRRVEFVVLELKPE